MGEKRKGSLSVEAVISMTVFIGVMFLLLTLVKLVLVMTILNNATTETAKTLATSGYVIGIINEQQADLEAKAENIEPTSLANSAKGTLGSSVITTLLTGGTGVDALKDGGKTALTNILEGVAVEVGKGYAYELKGQAVNAIVGSIVQQYIENCGLQLDPERLMLRAVKIPETSMEFKTLHKEALPLSAQDSLKAEPGTDFGKDDVLICLEYPYKIALPLIPSVTVTLRSTAVEHAWLNGTGSGPADREGICIEDLIFGDNRSVYIGARRKGEKYHKKDCITLWRGAEEMKLSEAWENGYKSPCKVCRP